MPCCSVVLHEVLVSCKCCWCFALWTDCWLWEVRGRHCHRLCIEFLERLEYLESRKNISDHSDVTPLRCVVFLSPQSKRHWLCTSCSTSWYAHASNLQSETDDLSIILSPLRNGHHQRRSSFLLRKQRKNIYTRNQYVRFIDLASSWTKVRHLSLIQISFSLVFDWISTEQFTLQMSTDGMRHCSCLMREAMEQTKAQLLSTVSNCDTNRGETGLDSPTSSRRFSSLATWWAGYHGFQNTWRRAHRNRSVRTTWSDNVEATLLLALWAVVHESSKIYVEQVHQTPYQIWRLQGAYTSACHEPAPPSSPGTVCAEKVGARVEVNHGNKKDKRAAMRGREEKRGEGWLKREARPQRREINQERGEMRKKEGEKQRETREERGAREERGRDKPRKIQKDRAEKKTEESSGSDRDTETVDTLTKHVCTV